MLRMMIVVIKQHVPYYCVHTVSFSHNYTYIYIIILCNFAFETDVSYVATALTLVHS